MYKFVGIDLVFASVERQRLLFFCPLVAIFIPDSVPNDICAPPVSSSAAVKSLFAIDFHIHAL